MLGDNPHANALLNLGDPDARAWISDRVDRLITTTGIDHYRQDMNFDRERCTNPSPSLLLL